MSAVQTITAQAGISGQVIDLHAEAFRTAADRPDGGRAEGRGACCPDCARFDRWVDGIGGITGLRFAELCAEARQEAGSSGMWGYLDMAMATDEEHAATAGEHLAAAVELANARSARRRAAAAAQATVDACLNRSAEIQLAADQLRADPRVARILAADLNGPDLSPAEVGLELRASMGLANRPPTPYEAGLPAVGDLAQTIGLRS